MRAHQEVHEKVDDIGSNVGEVCRALVDGMHKQVPVFCSLLQLAILRLHDLLLQHHDHLRAHALISILTRCKQDLMLQHLLT